MNINEFCGIAVTATLIVAVAMFVALLCRVNDRPSRNSSKRAEV